MADQIEPFEVVVKLGRLIRDRDSLRANFRWISGQQDKPPLDPPADMFVYDSDPAEFRDPEYPRWGYLATPTDLDGFIETAEINELTWRNWGKRGGALAQAGLLTGPCGCGEVFPSIVRTFFERQFLDVDVVVCIRQDKQYPIAYFTFPKLTTGGEETERVNFRFGDVQRLREALASAFNLHGIPAAATTRRSRGLGFAPRRPYPTKPG